MLSESVERELCDDVFGTEERVYLLTGRVDSVSERVAVHDDCVFQDECGERSEMDLFEGYFSVKPFGQSGNYLSGNKGLYLRKLYCQCCRKENAGGRDDYTPEYFDCSSDDLDAF